MAKTRKTTGSAGSNPAPRAEGSASAQMQSAVNRATSTFGPLSGKKVKVETPDGTKVQADELQWHGASSNRSSSRKSGWVRFTLVIVFAAAGAGVLAWKPWAGTMPNAGIAHVPDREKQEKQSDSRGPSADRSSPAEARNFITLFNANDLSGVFAAQAIPLSESADIAGTRLVVEMPLDHNGAAKEYPKFELKQVCESGSGREIYLITCWLANSVAKELSRTKPGQVVKLSGKVESVTVHDEYLQMTLSDCDGTDEAATPVLYVPRRTTSRKHDRTYVEWDAVPTPLGNATTLEREKWVKANADRWVQLAARVKNVFIDDKGAPAVSVVPIGLVPVGHSSGIDIKATFSAGYAEAASEYRKGENVLIEGRVSDIGFDSVYMVDCEITP